MLGFTLGIQIRGWFRWIGRRSYRTLDDPRYRSSILSNDALAETMRVSSGS